MPLQIVRQDITKMKVDAIVNTTNSEMVGYSGVDFAVHKAAGPLLDIECQKLAPLGLGTAKITRGYNLDCRYIIHTSGPVWKGGLVGESILLKSCYIESLKLAMKHGCTSVAFPLISSGTYGYPKDQVLKFAISVITEFLFNHEMTVYICVYDRESYEFSKKLFAEISDFLEDDFEGENDAIGGNCFSEFLIEKKCTSDFDESPICVDVEETIFHRATPSASLGSAANKSLNEYMKDMDKPFAYKLFDLIDERGMTDVECYKKANVDKKTFSKIKCNPKTYKPSKQTAVAFAIALKLNLDETQDLLASAGLTLSRSFTFDKIIRYFIQKEIYDIFEINEALFEFDQVLLGC